MSTLIDRFRENLQLAGHAERTCQSYVGAVLRLQRFYSKPLESITEEELRQYWLGCKEELGWSASTLRGSYSGIKKFFRQTLVREWDLLNQVRFKRDLTLPLVLSLQETRAIIDGLPTLQSRTFYMTLYSLGLRLLEGLSLQVADVLSDRHMMHVHAGKGHADRMVPLPTVTLQALRAYYKTHRNPRWLFPALGHNDGKNAGAATAHASDSGVQGALRRTLRRLGIKKQVTPHTFRHSYATHLIEANVPIRHVQKLLGHKSLNSTLIYLHVTTQAQTDSQQRVMQLMQGVLS